MSLQLDSLHDVKEAARTKEFKELCLACRSGDTEKVDKLISTGVDVNQMDEWNYSPLVLASLCGHIEIVKLLLNNAGAVCDRDTFEGARCIYGALNDEIRKLLLSFDINKAVDLSQPFVSHISSLFKTTHKAADESSWRSSLKDVEFKTADDDLSIIRAHRFILTSRCGFFKKESPGAATTSMIDVSQTLDLLTLKYLLNYVYLTLNSQITFSDIDSETLRELAKVYELDDLTELLDIEADANIRQSERSKKKNRVVFDMVERGREDFKKFCTENVIGRKIITAVEESDTEEGDSSVVSSGISSEQKLALFQSAAYPDIILGVYDRYSHTVAYYPAHRSILMRSGFFETFFSSLLFSTNDEDPGSLPQVITVPIGSSEAAEIILKYLYYDEVEVPKEFAVDVLVASDALFIDRLKMMSSVTITNSVIINETEDEIDSDDNEVGYTIYEILQIAWETRMDRLEQHVAKIIAWNLRQFIGKEKFRDMILESSERIKERQVTDTIELLDDIRYYLTRKYVVEDENYLNEKFVHKADVFEAELLLDEDFVSDSNRAKDLAEYDTDLTLIEALLADLGLDA